MKFISVLLAALLLAAFAPQTHARRVGGWSYQKLMDEADLVVIARPIGRLQR